MLTGPSDRGQAFTLEGFVASVVVLTAILLALQSVVLTPTTGGTVDQQVQQQLRTEAHDILVATAGNSSGCQPSVSTCPDDGGQDLSYLVRYWNGTDRTWAFATNRRIGYGDYEIRGRNDTIFGSALNATFAKRGYNYNVIVEYRDPTQSNRSRSLRMLYRGVPSNNAITTTYTVTLFDNDTLTGIPKTPPSSPKPCTERTLESINSTFEPGDCYYAVPEAAAFGGDPSNPEAVESDDSPIYNIVEIRVVVW